MKKFLFSLILLLVSYVGFSQKGLSYQAVILDPAKIEIPGQDISSQPLVNGDVWLKFSIYNGSTLQFEEVHKTKTDNYGLVNLLIGSVSATSFNSLVWDSSQKSLQVYVSFNQGGSYTKISDQKLNYNPYALFAETAGKLSGVLPVANGGTGATTATDARANLGLDQVNNTSDAAKPVSTATKVALDLKANASDVTAGLALKANTADVTSALDLKANAADMTAALAAKADTGTIKTFVVTQVAAANIADADATTKGKIQLAGDLAGTADAPTVPGLALKANEADVTTALALKANTADVTVALDLKANATDVTTALASKANGANVSASLSLKEAVANKSLNVSADGSSDLKYPSVKAVKTYVDAQVTAGVSSATIADASPSSKGKIQLAGDLGGTAAMPTVPGLALKAPIASPTFTGTVSTGTLSSTNISALTYASAPRELTYTGSAINWTPAQGLNAAITLTQNSDLNFTSPPPVGSYGTVVLTQDATGNRTITLPSIPNVSNKVLGSTSTSTVALSTAANSKDILNFYYDGTNCYWNIGQGYGTAASGASSTANLASGVTGTLPLANGGTGATTASAALTSLGGAPLASPTFTGAVTAPIYASTPQALTDASVISWNPSLGLNASVTLGGNRTLSFSTTPVAGAYGTLIVTQDGTGNRSLTLPSTTNVVLGSTSTTSIALSSAANATDILNFYYDGAKCYWNIGQGYGTAATGTLSTANLASGVTGTLPLANGGTGATTASAALTSLGGAPLASPTFTGTVSTSALSSTSITAPTYASTPIALTYTGTNINWNTALGLNAAITLTQNSGLNFTAAPPVGSYGTVVLTQDATGNRTITLPSITNVTNKVLGSTSTSTVALSTAANSKDILNFYYDGTNCYWNIGQGYGTAATGASSTANLASGVTGTLPLANGGTGATTASAALTSLGAAPIASPTFTGAVTSPIYASTPQTLTDASTITWNPSLGLNASVTLGGNRTLSFSTTPVAGAYGTLVINQDATGNRTITLPTMNGVTNKVLGSTSTTNIGLSTAAYAKDIVNFYFDGTICYWNIGQGYGSASSSSTSTNLASGVTGTLAVANGGTGATTLTGLVKGNGTGAMTAALAGTDYQAPLTLTTTGTGAATLSGTTLNIPTPISGGSGIQVVTDMQRDALNTNTSGVMIFNSTQNKYQGSIYYSKGYNYNYFTTALNGFSEIRPGYSLKQTFTGKGQVITSANIAVVDMNRVSNTGDFTFEIYNETYNYAIYSTTITLTGAGTVSVQIPNRTMLTSNGPIDIPRTLPNGLCSIRISSASNTGGSADFLLNTGVPVGSLYNTYFDFLGWSSPTSPDTSHQLAVDIFPQTGLTWVDLH